MTAHEAREAILAGHRVRMRVGEDPDDPVQLVALDQGVVLAVTIAGWSGGVVEPVCAPESPFLLDYLARGVTTGKPRAALDAADDEHSDRIWAAYHREDY